MKNTYLQSFVNKTAQYKKTLFCLAAGSSFLLSGQAQEADAAPRKVRNLDPEQAKRVVADLNEKMKICSTKSIIDLLAEKRQALETTMFSPKNAAVILAGLDACPGTAIPAGTVFNDSGSTTGANNTVQSHQVGCTEYTTTAGPDHVHRFVLPALGSRIASCSINLTSSAGDDHTIYTLSSTGGGCPAGTGNVVTNCVNGSDNVFDSTGGTETITDAEMDAMPAGTYYLFVDSFYAAGDPAADGPYTLNFNCTTLSPTAAQASVAGRVTTYDGRGIGNARVSVMLPSGESRFAITNPFGFYRFDDVEVGQSYVFQVASKGYEFSKPTRLIAIDGGVDNIDFVAENPAGGAPRK